MSVDQALGYSLHGDPARPPLLLLHGFLGSQGEWQALLPRLSAHWYCLLVDLPGHGQSACYRLPQLAGFRHLSFELATLMASISSQPWAIWGYSLGGRIALYLSLKQHLSLRWLLLESMHPGLETAAQRFERRVADQRWVERFAEQPMPAVLDNWYRQPVFAELGALARAKLVAERSKNDPQALALMLRATSLGRQPPLHSHLLRLPCPWRYLVGAKDAKFAAIARQMPRACTQQMPEAGHNIHRERPEALWSALQAFLSHADLVKELQ